MMEESMKLSNELLDFIQKSPSCYHAVENLAQTLCDTGFLELSEGAPWRLQRGGRYFIRRNLSSLLAFKIPEGEIRGFQIAASHSDSPTFKIKENMDIVVDGAYTELNVEKYGGMLCAPWFDRPLSVAGKIVVRRGEGVESRLVNVDRDLLMLPSLAIHMNRSVNDGYKYSVQKDMLPLLGDERAAGTFLDIVAGAAGWTKRISLEQISFCTAGAAASSGGPTGNIFLRPSWTTCSARLPICRAFWPAAIPIRFLYTRCLTMKKWAAAPNRARRAPCCWTRCCA